MWAESDYLDNQIPQSGKVKQTSGYTADTQEVHNSIIKPLKTDSNSRTRWQSESKFDFQFLLDIPYELLDHDSKLVPGQNGPSGFPVVEKYYENGIQITGEFNPETKKFEGLIKYEDEKKEHEYFGDFINSRKNGKGVFKFSNCDLYVGDFQDGEMSGEGIYYYMKTGSILQGDVFKGEKGLFGKGEYIWKNPPNQKRVFVGDIKHGLPHGEGNFRLVNPRWMCLARWKSLHRRMEIWAKRGSRSL